jgi:hypothetical protein
MEKSKVNLTASPSYQMGNLSYSVMTENVCYVRQSEVIVQQASSPRCKRITTRAAAGSLCVCSFAPMEDFDLLVVASSAGLQLWTADGATLRFFVSIGDMLPAEMSDTHDRQEGDFLAGIASHESGWIYVGTSWGNICRFEVPGEDDDVIMHAPIGPMCNASTPVCAAAASGDVLAYGNENGDVFFHTPGSDGLQIFKVLGRGAAVTAMVCREWAVATALSTGTINVYRADESERVLEIHAHARIIHSLTLRDGVMVSCGDDQIVSVWAFSESQKRSDTQVDFVESHRIPDRLLVGAVSTGSELLAIAYDDENLYSKTI